MTIIFLLVFGVLFEGEIHIFYYSKNERPIEFPSLAACERELKVQEAEAQKLLSNSAALMIARCLPRQVPGV